MKVPDGYKRCKCRDADGGEVGAACPRLRRKDGAWNPSHGAWYGKTDVPAPDGKREALRAGGFTTRDEMTGWFGAAIALLLIPAKGAAGHDARAKILAVIRETRRKGEPLPDPEAVRLRHATGAAYRPGTTGEYLLAWLARHDAAGDLKASTLRGYRDSAERWWIPQIGHVPLDQLTAGHILAVIEMMEEEATQVAADLASPDPAVRARVRGRRAAGLTTRRNHLANLSAALGEAASPAPGRPRLLAANPAAGIRLGGGRKEGKPKRSRALLWTKEREARWRKDLGKRAAGLGAGDQYRAWKNTAARPSNVMIWRADHLAAFLDHPQVQAHRLYPLFTVIAYLALRRGEGVGLPWEQVEWDVPAVMIGPTIVQVGWKAIEQDSAKSGASEDWVRAEAEVIAALNLARRIQAADKLAYGPGWTDSGKVFTRPDGTSLHPAYVSEQLYRLSHAAGLPPIRLHDLRHVAATLALAAGLDIKVVSAMLRHSSHVITGDLYASVLPELAASAASAVASMIPRKAAAGGEGDGRSPFGLPAGRLVAGVKGGRGPGPGQDGGAPGGRTLNQRIKS